MFKSSGQHHSFEEISFPDCTFQADDFKRDCKVQDVLDHGGSYTVCIRRDDASLFAIFHLLFSPVSVPSIMLGTNSCFGLKISQIAEFGIMIVRSTITGYVVQTTKTKIFRTMVSKVAEFATSVLRPQPSGQRKLAQLSGTYGLQDWCRSIHLYCQDHIDKYQRIEDHFYCLERSSLHYCLRAC
jgi:hypothetical protein